jgi:hypothetical protein
MELIRYKILEEYLEGAQLTGTTAQKSWALGDNHSTGRVLANQQETRLSQYTTEMKHRTRKP